MKSPRLRKLPNIVLAVAAVLAASSASGATRNWLGNNSVNWNDSLNWDTLPVSDDSLTFGAAGTAGATLTNDFTSFSFAGITFGATAPAYTIGGNDFTLTSGITNSGTELQTINNNIILSGTPTVTTAGSGGDIALGGALSSTGTLTKAGAGTLTLSGSNSYSGATTISGGVISVSTLAPNGSNSGIGSGTALTLDGGTLRYTGGNNGSSTPGTQFNRSIAVNAGGGTIDVAGSGFLFYNGSLSGSGTLKVVDTSGDANNRQLLVTGNSPSFSGNVEIGNGTANSGWVQYRSNAASPFGTGTITILTGGKLTSDNGVTTPVTLSNAIILKGGTLGAQNSATQYTGGVTVFAGTSSSLDVPGGQNLDISSSLSGSGTLTKNGGDFSVLLKGDNSGFTGTYNHTANGATIFYTANSGSASASWNIPSGSNANARFMAAGVNLTYKLGALSGTTGLLENLNSASGNSTFEIGALGTDTTFGGRVVNNGGTVSVAKVGAGALTLSGNNTYTGTTSVSAGALLVNGTHSGTGAVSVSAGTLGGIGSFASALTIGDGSGTADSIITGGTATGVGTLTTSSALSLSSDAKFSLQLDSSLGILDTLRANGVTLDAASAFSISDIAETATALTLDIVFIVIDNTSVNQISGTFAGLPEGSLLNIAANQFKVSYIGGTDANDMTLTVVPEPSCAALLGLGALVLARRRRR